LSWPAGNGLLAGLVLCLASGLALAAADDPAPAADSRLRVEGVEGQLADNLRLVLRLASEPCDAPRWRVRRLFAGVEPEVVQALRPFGYYTPQVHKQLEFRDGCWFALLRITPGERVRWTRVELSITGEAADDAAFQQPLQQARPAAGAPLLHADYEALKAQLLLLAAQRGYREGRFTRHQLLVDPARHSAEAVLHYDSGPRYRFGEVQVQQTAFAPDLITRYIHIQPGDVYDATEVARLQRTLLDSGLFSVVEVSPRFGTRADRRVPLDVRLEARKRHAYSVGLGASTDEGPRMRLGYENRRLNERGHSATAMLRLSAPRSGLDLAYNIPLRDPSNERLSLLAGYQNEEIDNNQSEIFKTGVRYSRRHSENLLETWFVEASQERFSIGEDSGSSRLIMPGTAWDWSRGDDPIYPRRAWRVAVELRGAARVLASDVDFVRAQLSAKRILPIGDNRLIARGEIGQSLVAGFDELPASQRFFAGGDNSVRGYGYRELGPRDASGQVIGGQRLLVGSLELERPIRDGWSMAVFADSGDAFNGRDLQLHHAVGVGVRWRSPVGPVRVDLAHPLDDDAAAVRLHFSLGPDL
jgi:translocation and assembly module TamA